MGLFGGSSQSTLTNSNNIDFNPIINIGDSNSNAFDKQTDLAQTTAPKLDDSFGLSASVGVGVGGTGSGGTASLQKSTNDDVQPAQTYPVTQNSSGLSGFSLPSLNTQTASFGSILPIALIGGLALFLIAKNSKGF